MDRGRILWGLLLLALGGVLLAGQLADVDAGAVIAGWWPVAVIVAGILRLLDRPRELVGATILIVAGVVLLAWRQQVLGGDELALVIPAMLIVGGLWVLFRRPRGKAAALTGSGPIDVVAILGGRDLRVGGDRFAGGQATAVLGGLELDLRGAVLPPEGARLELTAVLGGVDVTLPTGWDVQIDGPAVLGGTDDRTLPAPEGSPRLEIQASAVLGGITVRTDPEVPARRSAADAAG